MTTPAFREWLQTLAEAEASVPARIVLERLPEMSPIGDTPEARAQPATPDKLLKVHEAAERLGVDRRWIYRHADKLPFTRKLTSGTLRFSDAGIDRYLRTRKP